MIDWDAESLRLWKIIIGALLTVAAAIWGNSALRRRLSGDKVAIATGDSEISLLDRQQAEIERLRLREERLTLERNEAVSQVGGLREKILNLTLYIERLEKRIDNQQGQIEVLLARFSGPSADG